MKVDLKDYYWKFLHQISHPSTLLQLELIFIFWKLHKHYLFATLLKSCFFYLYFISDFKRYLEKNSICKTEDTAIKQLLKLDEIKKEGHKRAVQSGKWEDRLGMSNLIILFYIALSQYCQSIKTPQRCNGGILSFSSLPHKLQWLSR